MGGKGEGERREGMEGKGNAHLHILSRGPEFPVTQLDLVEICQ